jgi:hypothetical protein
MDAPLDDAPVLQLITHSLTHQHAAQSVGNAETTDDKHALVTKLHLQPQPRRARPVD